MIMGLAKFVISKVLAVIIVLVLILSDELLRRRDTVESKRIFNLALLTGIGALLDLVITAFTIICMGLQALYVIGALQIVLKAQKGRKPPSFLRLDAFLVPVIVGFVLYYGPFFTKFEPRDICIAIGVVLTWRSVRNSYKYVDPHTGPQSKSAIRLLIKAAMLKAKEADSSMEIESSYAIREKDESTEAFTKRLLDL